MKKTILILVIIFSIQININAQHEQQLTTANFTTFKYTALTLANNVSKNRWSSDSIVPEKNYDYYMQKSKNQRTTGWALLGGGVGLAGIGMLIANRNAKLDQVATGGIIAAVGGILGIISVPCLVMAGVNKHKAKAIIANQKTGLGVPANVSKDIVGITLQIPLGIKLF